MAIVARGTGYLYGRVNGPRRLGAGGRLVKTVVADRASRVAGVEIHAVTGRCGVEIVEDVVTSDINATIKYGGSGTAEEINGLGW